MDAPSDNLRFAHCGPSPDSDFNLRGAHVLPLEKVVGLSRAGGKVRFHSVLNLGRCGKRPYRAAEKSALGDADVSFHQSEYERLRGELQAAHDVSQLPEVPAEETMTALNDLLVRVRLNHARRRADTIP